jgi:hypothetical protein
MVIDVAVVFWDDAIEVVNQYLILVHSLDGYSLLTFQLPWVAVEVDVVKILYYALLFLLFFMIENGAVKADFPVVVLNQTY